MGHSTGSQDVINYLTFPSLSARPKVDGGIMQAPASDREYFSGGDDSGINAWLSNLPIAEQMMKDGKGDQVMDAKACEAMGIRITAYRLWSLLSEVYVILCGNLADDQRGRRLLFKQYPDRKRWNPPPPTQIFFR